MIQSILSGDISNLSTVSTFSKDLIDACANASAEMLDLHLTPYDLKSVHEYQISNDKKLSKILKIVEKVLSENAELKMTISGLSEKLNNLQSALRNNASSILQPLPATSSSFLAIEPKPVSSIPPPTHLEDETVPNKNSNTFDEEFPSLMQASKIPPKVVPVTNLRGWAIAAASLPSSPSSRENRKMESPILEMSGDIPEGSPNEIVSAVVHRLNESLCPMLNGLGKDFTSNDISHVMLKNQHSRKILVVRFTSEATKSFIYKNRKKLQNVENQKIFLSPHLSLEESQIQQRIVNVFKSFRTKDNDQFNFSIFAQGHFIKILSQGSRHFYAFDSKLSPKDFLISKGIISA